jgi:hypothetical protein
MSDSLSQSIVYNEPVRRGYMEDNAARVFGDEIAHGSWVPDEGWMGLVIRSAGCWQANAGLYRPQRRGRRVRTDGVCLRRFVLEVHSILQLEISEREIRRGCWEHQGDFIVCRLAQIQHHHAEDVLCTRLVQGRRFVERGCAPPWGVRRVITRAGSRSLVGIPTRSHGHREDFEHKELGLQGLDGKGAGRVGVVCRLPGGEWKFR